MKIYWRRFFLAFATAAGTAVAGLIFSVISPQDRKEIGSFVLALVDRVTGHKSETDPGSKRPVDAESILSGTLTPIGPTTLSIGDQIRFTIAASQKGFGHVYLVDTEGDVTLLAENLPLEANKPVAMPRSGLTLRAAAPTGLSNLVFVATRDTYVGFGLGGTVTDPKEIRPSAAGLESDLKTLLAHVDKSRWSISQVGIRVKN